MAVQEHNQCHGCSVRITLSVCEDLRYIKHLKATDDGSDQSIGKNRTNQWKRNIEETLNAVASVQIRCFKNIHTDSHYCCHQHDGRVSEPHQEIHETYQ